ncbi:MAG: hypothetical protein C5B45_00725 [Chlamydiae bacterium]|nr:MAG: hypothetical protein C5B45_00725 [Chlamydiota bacterium]
MIQDNLILAENHLSMYLKALGDSANIDIRIHSRWPWVTEVVVPYPNSLLDRLVLFIKTLRIYLPKEAKDQLLKRSIESLNIYKNAVNYQLLAHKPKYLHLERDILSNKNLLDQLDQIEHALLNEREITSDQKDSLREWAGRLADLHSTLRLDAILDFKKNPDILLKSIQSIKQGLQKRKEEIPSLLDNAINRQMCFFTESLIDENKIVERPLFEKVQLFSYFVSENPCKETISLQKQIDIAARLWNSNCKDKYRESLVEFKRFFENSIEEYGAPWDIANGMAYANLFKGI